LRHIVSSHRFGRTGNVTPPVEDFLFDGISISARGDVPTTSPRRGASPPRERRFKCAVRGTVSGWNTGQEITCWFEVVFRRKRLKKVVPDQIIPDKKGIDTCHATSD
jgi:hypothetical protein